MLGRKDAPCFSSDRRAFERIGAQVGVDMGRRFQGLVWREAVVTQ